SLCAAVSAPHSEIRFQAAAQIPPAARRGPLHAPTGCPLAMCPDSRPPRDKFPPGASAVSVGRPEPAALSTDNPTGLLREQWRSSEKHRKCARATPGADLRAMTQPQAMSSTRHPDESQLALPAPHTPARCAGGQAL